MTGFWAVKLTGFNMGKVNLMEKESSINNCRSIPRRPLMGKGLVYADLGAAQTDHILQGDRMRDLLPTLLLR